MTTATSTTNEHEQPDAEFTSVTFINGKQVTVNESMTTREKATAIVQSAVVVSYEHNGYPYAVVEVPVLTDTIEAWLEQQNNHTALVQALERLRTWLISPATDTETLNEIAQMVDDTLAGVSQG